MLKEIGIKNLRSIKEQKIKIAPITILYGPNGSGKSTLMNALAIFRNIVLNANQQLDSFFNLGFANFGGFEQVVFEHDLKKNIVMAIDDLEGSTKVTYQVTLGKETGSLLIQTDRPWNVKLEVETSFPYPMNQQKSVSVKIDESTLTVTWNGILVQVASATQSDKDLENAKTLVTLLNSPMENLKQCDFVNLMRGFSKPSYWAVPLTPAVYREDEVATVLANDHYLQDRVSYYLEQITNHELRIHVLLGTATFLLNTTDKATGLSTELVNDGFGINQVVYLLAKCLRKDTSVVCIEEPEIHLHPKALRNLVHVLVNLMNEEQKTIIISTHSEHLVSALLGAVAKKNLDPDKVACYLCTKEKKESIFKRQRINETGQVEGGLISFMEGQLEDLKYITGVQKKGE